MKKTNRNLITLSNMEIIKAYLQIIMVLSITIAMPVLIIVGCITVILLPFIAL